MAIEKMKKLRLLAVRDQKKALLGKLQLLGCMEVSEPDLSELSPELRLHLSREGSDVSRYKSDLAAFVQAVELLDKYAPVKTKLLSAKPETDVDDLLDDSTLPTELECARRIVAIDETVRRINAETARIAGAIDALRPWLALDYPLDKDGTERCALTPGFIPAAVETDDVRRDLAELTDEAELVSVSDDSTQHYMVLICFRENLAAALDVLRAHNFSSASFAGAEGTAKENTERLNAQIEKLNLEKQELNDEVAALGEHRQALKLCADRMETKVTYAEAEGQLYGMESAVALQGWVLARKVPELEGCLGEFDCAWELVDPEPEEYPDVPVSLRNNKITNALNMVTNMYSLPAYDGVDPNPLMAPFFILFYGLMMADMGYGLIMILAAVVAMKKIHPCKGALSFCQLLLYAGISTFIMGILTGGFFGDALVQIGKLLGKPDGWGELWCLFSPMTDVMTVLIGAMVLGLIHLNTGMVISVVEKIKNGDVAGAIWEEGSLWVILIGAIMTALNVGNIKGVPVVLIIGCVMLFYGGSRGAKGIGKLTSLFATLYNTVTGWFGDILSYSRIMALMLAGSVIATVFNTIGGIANSLAVFIPVFLIGHSLNFALNLLGCYVHDLRLQCLEYFGKFYKDGGRAFKPLEVSTKYYDIAED
jgi:V/A-type H+/Na+-transporting ATPase subunit I